MDILREAWDLDDDLWVLPTDEDRHARLVTIDALLSQLTGIRAFPEG